MQKTKMPFIGQRQNSSPPSPLPFLLLTIPLMLLAGAAAVGFFQMQGSDFAEGIGFLFGTFGLVVSIVAFAVSIRLCWIGGQNRVIYAGLTIASTPAIPLICLGLSKLIGW